MTEDSEIIERLAQAMNDHDLDRTAALIHESYRSEQPAHPGREFVGRQQMRANWSAMFAGIPDFQAELRASVRAGDTIWSEWRWSGTRTGGQPFEVLGVTLFQTDGRQITAGRLYMEEVQAIPEAIEDAVDGLSGRRPNRVEPA